MATDGLPHQVIHQHLGEAHSEREVAEKARAAAEKRSAQLSAGAMHAEKAWAGSRERASKCMHAAHAASRASLAAMEHACAHDDASLAAMEIAAELDEPEWLLSAAKEVCAVPPPPPSLPPHPEISPEISPEPAATEAEFRHAEAEEGHVAAESSAHLGAHELGLHARLSSAYAEAER